ncbi:hypothetical protein IWX91DRAFT_344745, partial [Phyllosticta citricarpa]
MFCKTMAPSMTRRNAIFLACRIRHLAAARPATTSPPLQIPPTQASIRKFLQTQGLFVCTRVSGFRVVLWRRAMSSSCSRRVSPSVMPRRLSRSYSPSLSPLPLQTDLDVRSSVPSSSSSTDLTESLVHSLAHLSCACVSHVTPCVMCPDGAFFVALGRDGERSAWMDGWMGGWMGG